MTVQSISTDLARLRQVLGPFYKTVDVMKAARNSESHIMCVWADDMKVVEDVMFFLEQLRDADGVAQASPDRDRIAKAIYASWFDADHCTENHFQWFDAGKDDPDSCVHYSNVAKAYKAADRVLAAAPQPASIASGNTWTPVDFWKFVGGLAGEFEADQMRDMLAQRGLQIVGISDDAYEAKEPHETTYLRGWNEGIDAAIDAMPSTAENPNEDAYQRGRFDGIMEYQRAMRDLSEQPPTPSVPSTTLGGEAK